METLQTRVAQNLEDRIIEIGIREGWSKTTTLHALLMLALANPDHEMWSESAGKDVANCYLELSNEEYQGTLEYRVKHRLNKKAAFFRDALKRGLAVYIAEEASS